MRNNDALQVRSLMASDDILGCYGLKALASPC